MYCYELLCMDVERTRSIWISHDQEITPEQFQRLFEDVEAGLSPETLRRVSVERGNLRQTMHELGEALHLDQPLMQRWQAPATAEVVYRDVLDHLVDHLCVLHGFRRLAPTAVAVRYGSEVLVT